MMNYFYHVFFDDHPANITPSKSPYCSGFDSEFEAIDWAFGEYLINVCHTFAVYKGDNEYFKSGTIHDLVYHFEGSNDDYVEYYRNRLNQNHQCVEEPEINWVQEGF